MMRLSSKAVVAAVAVCLVGAWSTASAQAAVWRDAGTPVTKFFELKMSGQEVIEIGGGLGAVACTIKVKLTSSGGSIAQITEWKTQSCIGTEGSAPCKLATEQSKSLPWSVAVNAADLSIVNGVIKRTFSGTGCPLTSVETPAGTTTATPDSTASIHEFSLVGAAPNRHGQIIVEAPSSGTYGIG